MLTGYGRSRRSRSGDAVPPRADRSV